MIELADEHFDRLVLTVKQPRDLVDDIDAAASRAAEASAARRDGGAA